MLFVGYALTYSRRCCSAQDETGCSRKIKRLHTKLLLSARFELLMRHQVIDTPGHRLNMVDDEFVQVRVLVRRIHHKTPSDVRASISVDLGDI